MGEDILVDVPYQRVEFVRPGLRCQRGMRMATPGLFSGLRRGGDGLPEGIRQRHADLP